MKKCIVAFLIAMFAIAAHAAPIVKGSCVYPQTKILPNGYLAFKKPIPVYDAPNGNSIGNLNFLDGYMVGDKKGTFVLIKTIRTTHSNLAPNTNVGWVSEKDMEIQGPVGCQ